MNKTKKHCLYGWEKWLKTVILYLYRDLQMKNDIKRKHMPNVNKCIRYIWQKSPVLVKRLVDAQNM